MRSFAISTLVAASLVATMPARAGSDMGRILLTIAGDVSEPTRGAGTADDPSTLGALGVTFDQATEFDAAGLAALAQGEVTKTLFPGAEEATYGGPRLAALLEAVGLPGGTALPMGLDGYQPAISADLIAEHDPILATHRDGQPLGIGGLGPTMVVFPAVADPAIAEELSALEVWSTFFIEVE